MITEVLSATPKGVIRGLEVRFYLAESQRSDFSLQNFAKQRSRLFWNRAEIWHCLQPSQQKLGGGEQPSLVLHTQLSHGTIDEVGLGDKI